MLFESIFAFSILLLTIKCDAPREPTSGELASNLDQKLYATFYGYTDLQSDTDTYQCRCGQDSITKTCKLCVHVLYLKLNKKSSKSSVISKKQFDHASNRIYEIFEFVQFFNSQNYDSFNFAMGVANDLNSIVEEWRYELSKSYVNYYYDEIYGINREMKATYKFILRPANTFKPFRFFLLRIDSIIWKKYRLADNSCCRMSEVFNVCLDDCDFTVTLLINDEFSSDSSPLPHSNGKDYYPNVHLYQNNQKIFKNKLNVTISLYSALSQLIERIELSPINASPNTYYIIPKISGKYQPVIINMSYEFICNDYQSVNCMEPCSYSEGTNICDPSIGKKICTDGTIDPPTCLQHQKNCSEIFCKNEGQCVENNNSFGCICTKGYRGIFCEEYECKNDCNKNGKCIAPNKCQCTLPFEGEECDISVCSATEKNPCNRNNSCYIKKGNIFCICQDIFTGDFCQILVCKKGCIFGKCELTQEKNNTECVCSKHYKGESCDEYFRPLYFSSKQKSIIIALACIVVLNVALIILYFLINFLILRRRGNSKSGKIKTTNPQNIEIRGRF